MVVVVSNYTKISILILTTDGNKSYGLKNFESGPNYYSRHWDYSYHFAVSNLNHLWVYTANHIPVNWNPDQFVHQLVTCMAYFISARS